MFDRTLLFNYIFNPSILISNCNFFFFFFGQLKHDIALKKDNLWELCYHLLLILSFISYLGHYEENKLLVCLHLKGVSDKVNTSILTVQKLLIDEVKFYCVLSIWLLGVFY